MHKKVGRNYYQMYTLNYFYIILTILRHGKLIIYVHIECLVAFGFGIKFILWAEENYKLLSSKLLRYICIYIYFL